MFIRPFYSADTGTGGTNGAPASNPPAAPGASAPQSAGSAPTAAPAAPSGVDLSGITERLASLEAALAAKDAKIADAESAKLTAEQKAAQDVASLKKLVNDNIVKANVAEAWGSYTYTGAEAKAAALKLFNADHRFDVAPDGATYAVCPDGKKRTVADAFAVFMGGSGALFKSASVLPGGGPPTPVAPDAKPKSVHDLSDSEFQALLERGVSGKFTNDTKAPTFTIKTKKNPWEARRNELLGKARSGLPNGGKP